MMLLALAALVASPQYSEDQMKKDAEILLSVTSEAMTVPVLRCAQSRIKAHTPSPGEVGDLKKAAELTGTTFEACGFAAQSDRLEQAIRANHPETTADEAKRLAQVAFGMPFVIVLGDAAELLKATPPAPPSIPIEIPLPCRPDLARKPGHPCYEKPKQ